MKTLLISLILFIFTIEALAQSQDTIYWSTSYKLTWHDFKGIADSTSEYGAISNPVIKYYLSANEDSFKVRVACFFIKSRSWVRVFSKILLIHEQGHFDIAELHARKLRKAFTEYKFNYRTVKEDFDKIFAQIRKERAEMDMLYDKETNFSRNKLRQEKWNKKISSEIEQLKKYAS